MGVGVGVGVGVGEAEGDTVMFTSAVSSRSLELVTVRRNNIVPSREGAVKVGLLADVLLRVTPSSSRRIRQYLAAPTNKSVRLRRRQYCLTRTV